MLGRQALDQFESAGRAALFAGLQQQGDGGKVLEAGVMQDFEGGDGGDHPGLLIAHTRTVSARVVHAEGPLRHGAVREHRVHMRNHQDAALAGAVKDGHQMIGQARQFRRFLADLRAQRRQLRCQKRQHLVAARHVAGAGINVDDPAQQIEEAWAAGFHRGIDFVIAFGRGGGRRGKQDGAKSGECLFHLAPVFPHQASRSASQERPEFAAVPAGEFPPHGVFAGAVFFGIARALQ